MPMQISISNAIGGGGGAKGSGPSFGATNSFSFDGVDEYFLGQNTYTELDGQNNFTFSFWIKPTNLTDQVVFSIGNGAADTRAQQFFFRLFSTGQVYIYMRDLGKYARTSVGAITANVWQHVLVCRDQSEAIGQKAKIFIDGVDATSYDGTRYWSNTTPATTGLMIGEHTNGYSAPFLGNIDEFAIWDTDLRNDVSTIYNNGEPSDLNELATPPITWHRMGENATLNGSIWTMTDVNGGYINNSVNMAEANRTTDVPPNPFANTQSIQLDGIDDYIDCGDNDNLSFGDGVTDSPFSISTWINIGNTKSRGVVSKYGSIGTEYLFYMVSGKVRLLLNDTINASSIFATGSTALTLNTWYHIGITYDGSGLSGINIYVDGAVETLTTSGSGYVAMSNTNQPLEIGKYSTLEFLGKVDEVAIFNSELSQGDITTIYNAGVPNDISSLAPLSWWRFEKTGLTAIDSGTGGNNGTLTNGVIRSTDVPTFSKKSIALDGIDDFITMGNIIDFANDGTEAFSFSCWFKTTDTASQFLISKQLNGSPFNGYNIQLNNNTIGIFLGTTSSSARIQGSTSTIASISDGNWHHLTVTYDGSQDISGFTIYYDNSTQAITTINANNTPNNIVNSSDFMLGARGTAASYNKLYDGLLDEVAYFDSEISSSDVNAIYNGGVPSNLNDLSITPISWWRCGDNDTSPTLTDNGSGGNDGTMTNFTTFSTDVPT